MALLPRLLPALRSTARRRPLVAVAAGGGACTGWLASAVGASAAAAPPAASAEFAAAAPPADSAALPKPQWPRDSREEWAYPSPYHAADAVGHAGPHDFAPLPEDRFRDRSTKWRLKALVEHWQTLEGEESWPWVWTQPNPNGPHHVFVGADDSLLDRCKAVAAACPRNNITIIVESEEALKQHVLRISIEMADFSIENSSKKWPFQ